MKGASVYHDPLLDEEVHRRVFASGLTVYVVRKRGFAKSYATLAARYGSTDTRLRRNGRAVRLPDGTAHFLEHKVFETPEGDAFELFAARGASANAFTSFSSTRYLFGTSRDFAGNLGTLLDTVFELHVNEANVEKEKGIIGQEIAMYDDDPSWRIYFGALRALYRNHPVRIDIAGTAKSIGRIDAALLRDVHRAYYHPRNMVLAAVSPEPIQTTFRAVERHVEPRHFGRGPGRRTPPPAEPRQAARKTTRARLSVLRPRLLLALKDRPAAGGGRRRLRCELASAIVLDCLFGNSGSVFLPLYEAGLVDESFSCSYAADDSYAFAMVGGETDDIPTLRRGLERALEDALADGIGSDDFERVRNKELGGYARAFNSPERIAHMLVGHHLRGTTIGDYRDLLFRVTRAEANRRLRELFDPAVRCYSLVAPR